ncbi:MAG: hypothetical protein AB7G87_09835 [Clostridia bacterium]
MNRVMRGKPFPTRLLAIQLFFSRSHTVCKEELANAPLPILWGMWIMWNSSLGTGQSIRRENYEIHK